MVLPEAMACGLPCVSFACPCGPSEIITDGEDGFLVPPGDVRTLARRVQRLMDDESLRRSMGAEARRNIRRFSPAQVMAQWEALFAELCKRPVLGEEFSKAISSPSGLPDVGQDPQPRNDAE